MAEVGVPSVLALCAVAFSSVSSTAQSSQSTSTSPTSQTYEVLVQRGVPMTTRDGVRLFADVYHPKSDDKFPVVLIRTPYDKSVGWTVAGAFKIAPRGYVVVIQDVRGRYTSEGEWARLTSGPLKCLPPLRLLRISPPSPRT
jgi:predicted acyl esterase